MNKLFYHIFHKSTSISRVFTLILVMAALLSACDQVDDNPNQNTVVTESTALPTSVVTPTPVATSIPSRLEQPYESAVIEGNFSQIFERIPFSSETVKSDPNLLLVLGKSYYLTSNYTFAIEVLRFLSDNFPGTEESHLANYLLGEIFTELERYEEAIDSYTKLLGIDPALDQIFIPKLADAYSYSGNYLKAIAYYQQALINEPDNENYTIKIGRAEMYNGDLSDAINTFQAVRGSTTNDYTKAQMNLHIGQAYVLLDDLPNAYIPWQENISEFPLSGDSFQSLIGLINYDQPVDQFQRGLVDHFAGKDDIAIIAFEEYIATETEPDPSVYYYLGLSQRSQGEYEKAIESFDKLITDHPEAQYWTSAWDEKAYTYWAYMDDHQKAWQVLENYAINYPQNATASNYLFEAGRIHERFNDLTGAASLWEGLPIQFPDSAQRSEAMFAAGITRYRNSEFDKAIQDLRAAFEFTPDQDEQAKIMFWIGKSQLASGQKAEADLSFESVINSKPFSYYGFRAKEIIAQSGIFGPPTDQLVPVDLVAAKDEGDFWFRVLLDLPDEFDLDNLGDIQERPNFIRGLFYWNAGEFQLARKEFSLLSLNYTDDEIANYKLSNYMLGLGNYADARMFMEKTVNLIGYSDPILKVNLPAYFVNVLYGTHFTDQIVSAATRFDLDPFFLTAMIWQESAFDPYARSYAGAIGLMQIMPSTGQDIAKRSGLVGEFSTDMLYQPELNILLGSYYLNSNLNYLGDDLFAALAGYNAGPGNASIWQDLAKGDLDLELEIIRYGETRQYIKGIYTAYEMYKLFYE